MLLLSSVSVYAACYPLWGSKDRPCQCQYPIIDSNGKIGCGEDYCAKNGKKCMPNGGCCDIEKYCETSEKGKQCCNSSETCDTRNGCVNAVCENIYCGDGECQNGVCVAEDGTTCEEGKIVFKDNYVGEYHCCPVGSSAFSYWDECCDANEVLVKVPFYDPEDRCCPKGSVEYDPWDGCLDASGNPIS